MTFGQDEKTRLPLLFHIKNEEFVSLFCFPLLFDILLACYILFSLQSFHSEIKKLKSPAFPDVINYHQEKLR